LREQPALQMNLVIECLTQPPHANADGGNALKLARPVSRREKHKRISQCQREPHRVTRLYLSVPKTTSASGGQPAASISATTYGETNPPVPTGDSVSDQKNRSVEITVAGRRAHNACSANGGPPRA